MTDPSEPAQAPKQAMLSEKIANKLDPSSSIRTWLATYLTADNSCRVQTADILEGYAIDFNLTPSIPDQPAMTVEQLRILINAVFPAAIIDKNNLQNVKMSIPSVVGVRWKTLPKTTVLSHTVHVRQLVEMVPIFQHAQQFLYMNQPYRTLAWLWLYFSPHPNSSISMDGLYSFYCSAFQHAEPEYKVLNQHNFVGSVLGTIEGSSVRQVSKCHFVIHGMAFSPTKRTPEDVLQEMRQVTFQEMLNKGKIANTPPKTKFAKALWEEEGGPLLMLPDNIPGPVSDRLNRRGKYPLGPLYVEEPGFPGINVANVTRNGVVKFPPFQLPIQRTLDDHAAEGKGLGSGASKPEPAVLSKHGEDKMRCCRECREEEFAAIEAQLKAEEEAETEKTTSRPGMNKTGAGKGKGKAG